jgi:hypothetical protein
MIAEQRGGATPVARASQLVCTDGPSSKSGACRNARTIPAASAAARVGDFQEKESDDGRSNERALVNAGCSHHKAGTSAPIITASNRRSRDAVEQADPVAGPQQRRRQQHGPHQYIRS